MAVGYGLDFEHRGRGRVRGLVHRDVTPHNVLVSWQGAIKLADFGVAQVLEGAVTAHDARGVNAMPLPRIVCDLAALLEHATGVVRCEQRRRSVAQ